MNNEECTGGELYINDMTIGVKDDQGWVDIDINPQSSNIANVIVDADQAKLIVDNLSSQFNLEYAGVKDIYKMIGKLTLRIEHDEYDSGFNCCVGRAVKEIEQRYPQVKK